VSRVILKRLVLHGRRTTTGSGYAVLGCPRSRRYAAGLADVGGNRVTTRAEVIL
jgi:hypothetical protein